MSTRIQPVVTASQLGTLLQSARKSRKLTQAQLGARLGLQLSVQQRGDSPSPPSTPGTEW